MIRRRGALRVVRHAGGLLVRSRATHRGRCHVRSELAGHERVLGVVTLLVVTTEGLAGGVVAAAHIEEEEFVSGQ